jgi:hypothetical protein
MSDQPRDLNLERPNRLAQAAGDLMESHATQGRMMNRMLDVIGDKLDRIDGRLQALAKELRGMASEQVLLGNRVGEAFSRAFRTNLRLDDIEDRSPAPAAG